jgi:hypothetical protein
MKSKWTLVFWLLIALLMALMAYAEHGKARQFWIAPNAGSGPARDSVMSEHSRWGN